MCLKAVCSPETNDWETHFVFSRNVFLNCTSLCTLRSVDLIVSNKEPLSSPRLSHAEEATRADISFWIFIYSPDNRRAFIVPHVQGLTRGLFVCLVHVGWEKSPIQCRPCCSLSAPLFWPVFSQCLLHWLLDFMPLTDIVSKEDTEPAPSYICNLVLKPRLGAFKN